MQFFVRTGGNELTIEAKSPMDAICEAFEKIVAEAGAMGQIAICSTESFTSCKDDDLIISSIVALEHIGFRQNGGTMTRCGQCRGVGRIDCCDNLACPDCGGQFTRDCPACSTEPVTSAGA